MRHAIHITTANLTDRSGAIEMLNTAKEDLENVTNVLVDGGYSGEPFSLAIKNMIDANLEKKLVIELDGGQHNEEKQIKYDTVRTLKLTDDGFLILRFWNNEIFTNIDGVLEAIYEALNKTPHPPQKTRRPLPQGER